MSDTWYRAMLARDRRFDGVFFVGVKTTGIYCRPVCTARTPGPSRCEFFTSRIDAEREGFRACFRCRPELAPGNAPVDAVPRLVDQAVCRIEQGALNEGSVETLAEALNVSGRHLRRAMTDQLGLSPVELAQHARLGFAKRLLQDSALPLAELAFAAGFQSVRRFNSAFRSHFGRSPSSLRRERPDATGDVKLRLDYRPPLAWEALLAFLAYRAIPGVESVEGGTYHRTVELDGRRGWVSVTREGERLVATVCASLLGSLMPLVAKLRGLFDLDAHPAEVDAVLKRHPALRSRVRRTPGLRVPGAFDAFETAVRAVLGQQISVKGATTIAGRVVQRFGKKLDGAPARLTHVFPTAKSLARATVDDVAGLGMPGARARSLIGLAAAIDGGLTLARGVPLEPTLEKLKALPGIGEWTAQYLAMRALSWPDAFPASDLGVLKALGVKDAKQSLLHAEAFRPWRAYATLHLWSPP
ncbi:MAG: DNA-3-methyladenine glycosylase 2 family protein [Myxococcaceae bacterium]|nr:DNA-3-methyladenine glycosylase 2 family protein [Myxococcaceae bacterium]